MKFKSVQWIAIFINFWQRWGIEWIKKSVWIKCHGVGGLFSSFDMEISVCVSLEVVHETTWSTLNAVVELSAVVTPLTNLPAPVTRTLESQCRQKWNYVLTSGTLFFIGWGPRQMDQDVLRTHWGSKFHYCPLQAVPRGETDVEKQNFPLCFEQMMINWVNSSCSTCTVNHQFTWVTLWKGHCTKYYSLFACITALAFAHL